MTTETSPITKAVDSYEITVDVPNGVELDRLLFGNDLGFNTLKIVVKGHVPVFYSGIGPKLSHVLDHGIVISCDCAEMGDDENDGFHNYFIPWSQIVYVYQYIST